MRTYSRTGGCQWLDEVSLEVEIVPLLPIHSSEEDLL
jgi:hypothetical protein